MRFFTVPLEVQRNELDGGWVELGKTEAIVVIAVRDIRIQARQPKERWQQAPDQLESVIAMYLEINRR